MFFLFKILSDDLIDAQVVAGKASSDNLQGKFQSVEDVQGLSDFQRDTLAYCTRLDAASSIVLLGKCLVALKFITVVLLIILFEMLGVFESIGGYWDGGP